MASGAPTLLKSRRPRPLVTYFNFCGRFESGLRLGAAGRVHLSFRRRPGTSYTAPRYELVWTHHVAIIMAVVLVLLVGAMILLGWP
jgi:hypothetical protein